MPNTRRDLHPGTVWLDTFQVMTSELLGAYAPQDLATTSYALAKFAYRPKPAWLLRLQEVALLKEDDFTEQALAIAAWSVLVLDTGKVCDSMLARAVRLPLWVLAAPARRRSSRVLRARFRSIAAGVSGERAESGAAAAG